MSRKRAKISASRLNFPDSNLLTFNVDKTQYMTFSPKTDGQPEGLQLQIHHPQCDKKKPCQCLQIQKTKTYKYLGLTIDMHLRWDQHILLTTKRIRQTLYKFRQLRDILDKDTLRTIYFALVQSVATYGILAWGGTRKLHLLPIEKGLKSILRVSMNKPNRHPTKNFTST